ncbi:MAG: glycosyltransferase [Butyrivibrio sp.]|nr:glycosyltransferase [Butyrivibrio sp.]
MKISIVVPVYNPGDALKPCLDALLTQDYEDFEVIAVDDGATDGSGKILDEYAAGDSRLRVIHKENGGVSSARNRGLDEITGEYVIFVDSDDCIEKGTCKDLTKYIESFGKQRPDVIEGCLRIIRPNGDKKAICAPCLSKDKLYTCSEFLENVAYQNQFRVEVSGYIYKASFIKENDLKFAQGIYHEDLEWAFQFLCKDPVLAYYPKVFYNYILRGGSIMSAGSKEKRKNDLLRILEKYNNDFRLLRGKKEFRPMMGLLVRQYIHECAEFKIPAKESKSVGLTNKESLKFAIGKDKLKALIFILNRNGYYRIYDKKFNRS